MFFYFEFIVICLVPKKVAR